MSVPFTCILMATHIEMELVTGLKMCLKLTPPPSLFLKTLENSQQWFKEACREQKFQILITHRLFQLPTLGVSTTFCPHFSMVS